MAELQGVGGGDGTITGLQEYISATASNSYVVEDGEDGGGDNDGEPGVDGEPLREQDRFLPIANVHRFIKKGIPKSGKVAKDAKECIQECVSEFISFVTSEASERCHQEKRKTINGEDILFAMSTLGFDNYVEPLKCYLQKYRETLHQSNAKQEKMVADAALEELSASEAAFENTLTTSSILGDQAQQGVIYATYPAGIQQSLNFG